MLTARGITVCYDGKPAVDSVSFELLAGQWLMLAGPNGAGKSTLIKAIAQTVPYEGTFLLNQHHLKKIKAAERARMIGVLSQHNSAEYAYTVEEIVRLGRYAYRRGFFSRQAEDDEREIASALALTGMAEYRRASVLSLSGGEVQRVFLAQVFAQNPQLLILDEPTNHLDLKYQQHALDLVAEWLKQPGRAVVSVMHDVSLAKKYGTHALLLNRGKTVAYGTVDAVFSRENLEAVYEMDVYAWMRELLAQWQGKE
ncbi:MAG: ABC transporter ATP-binding protein [Clostridia bacterium]|nr:ABC transporter ATP-binding protein [Clostridia bacterium]